MVCLLVVRHYISGAAILGSLLFAHAHRIKEMHE